MYAGLAGLDQRGYPCSNHLAEKRRLQATSHADRGDTTRSNLAKRGSPCAAYIIFSIEQAIHPK